MHLEPTAVGLSLRLRVAERDAHGDEWRVEQRWISGLIGGLVGIGLLVPFLQVYSPASPPLPHVPCACFARALWNLLQ